MTKSMFKTLPYKVKCVFTEKGTGYTEGLKYNTFTDNEENVYVYNDRGSYQYIGCYEVDRLMIDQYEDVKFREVT